MSKLLSLHAVTFTSSETRGQLVQERDSKAILSLRRKGKMIASLQELDEKMHDKLLKDILR